MSFGKEDNKLSSDAIIYYNFEHMLNVNITYNGERVV